MCEVEATISAGRGHFADWATEIESRRRWRRGGWRTERALFEDNKGLLTGSDSDSGSLYEIF